MVTKKFKLVVNVMKGIRRIHVTLTIEKKHFSMYF